MIGEDLVTEENFALRAESVILEGELADLVAAEAGAVEGGRGRPAAEHIRADRQMNLIHQAEPEHREVQLGRRRIHGVTPQNYQVPHRTRVQFLG